VLLGGRAWRALAGTPRSAARRAGTPRSAARRAQTPRSAARRAAAGQTTVADDSSASASFHTPAATHLVTETPPAHNLKITTNAPKKNAPHVPSIELEQSRLERERNSSKEELLASQKEVIGLKCTIVEMSSASSKLRAELETLQRQSNHQQADNTRLTSEVTLANAEIQDLQVSVLDFFIHLF
jgi:hypothetical protein